MTAPQKERKVRHRPSVVGDHQAYLHGLMAELDRAGISLRLGESLAAAGITQQEMADLLHVHKRSVEDYVSPKVGTIPFDRLDEWAKATSRTKEWLLHGEQREASPEELAELHAAVEGLQRDVDEILRLLRGAGGAQPGASEG